jgi:hypothetical protein
MPNFDLNVKSTVFHPSISVAKACRTVNARHQFWLDAVKQLLGAVKTEH